MSSPAREVKELQTSKRQDRLVLFGCECAEDPEDCTCTGNPNAEIFVSIMFLNTDFVKQASNKDKKADGNHKRSKSKKARTSV